MGLEDVKAFLIWLVVHKNVALDEGDTWAIQFILERTYSKPKPVTDPESLDADKLRADIELTQIKIKEIAEFGERLKALTYR